MNIILLGIPGSGKSTQATKISEYLQIPYLGAGNMVRIALENKFKEYKESVAKGFLLPDDIVFRIVTDKIDQFDLNKGFVMEGYPRTVAQAELLDLFLLEKHSKLDIVINLVIGDVLNVESRILDRKQCMYCNAIVITSTVIASNTCPKCKTPNAFRLDDCVDSFQTRMNEYTEKTLPVVNYYSGKGIINKIDASMSIENVFQSTLAVINSIPLSMAN